MPVRTESRVPQSWCLSRSQRARQAAGARGNSAPKPTGPRRAPAQHPRVTTASLLVGVRAHLGLLALAGTAITCLVFLFASSGSWMFALTEDSGIGFAPDPAYWTMNAEQRLSRRLRARHLPERHSCRSLRWRYADAFAGPSMRRTPERSRGARHIALATGSWRPSHRITSRTGPLRRHRRRDCNRAEPAGRAGEPPRGSPRVARAPTCTRLGRQRIIHRLRARAVPPHPPTALRRSESWRSASSPPAWRSSRSQR